MLKHENFVYWLQGFFEISGATALNEEQVKIIKEHIDLCFDHVERPQTPTTTTSPYITPDWVNQIGGQVHVGGNLATTTIC